MSRLINLKLKLNLYIYFSRKLSKRSGKHGMKIISYAMDPAKKNYLAKNFLSVKVNHIAKKILKIFSHQDAMVVVNQYPIKQLLHQMLHGIRIVLHARFVIIYFSLFYNVLKLYRFIIIFRDVKSRYQPIHLLSIIISPFARNAFKFQQKE